MRRLVAAALLLAAVTRPAAAQLGPNLIAPAGWVGTFYGPCPFYVGAVGDFCLVSDPGEPIGEDEFGTLYGPGPAQTAAQTFATTAGAEYRVQFSASIWAYAIGIGVFDATWDGVSLTSWVGEGGGSGVNPFVGVVTATGPTATLAFSHVLAGPCRDGFCADWEVAAVVGGVSVQQILATPEPATLALAATGLLGVALVRRRA
jgi:hypothetical protein